jgi:dihydroxyacetone kinase/dihydroxyacetone kinase-like protein
MRKFLNDSEHFVTEMLKGILAAHPEQLRAAEADPHVLVRASSPQPGKVGIVTGGGSGHLPLFLGYVGTGLLDGVAVGDVFASPSADQVLQATRAVDGGAGVLYLYGNYGGDVMNFDLATELAEAENIRVRTIVGADDVGSAPPDQQDLRRGIAGIVLLYKIAGAAAERGASLDEVLRLTAKAADNLRTFGVALSPMTLPSVGRPTFELPEGEMELGMGIHGEAGVSRSPLAPADDVADTLLDTILTDMPMPTGARVVVLLNGLGATPQEELYVLYRRVHERLKDAGVQVHRPYIGEFVTSLEMVGASLSLLVVDDELAELIDARAKTPFFEQS